MKCENLYQEFKKFEGQPVKVYTDDGKTYCGIDLGVEEDAVRILDDCGRIIYIVLSHVDTVIEPRMNLKRCCKTRCDECYDEDSNEGCDD